MAIDYDPLCAICGVPFSHVDIVDFSKVGGTGGLFMTTTYNSQKLSAAQCAYISQFRIIARIADTGTHSGINHTREPDVFISNQGKWLFDEQWETMAPDWVNTDRTNENDAIITQYEKFFPVHSVCVNLLQIFTQHQSRIGSPHPKSVKEFVDTCAACQDFSNGELGRTRTGKQNNRPPDYGRYGCVEWSHLYFGARRFWADPWDCETGHEYLCSDPVSEPQANQFIRQCLAYPKSTSHTLFSFSIKQLQPKDSPANKSPLMRCPSEILQLIASQLPLKSAINLHASSQQLSSLITLCEDKFWRFHTLRLHGSWFWELCGRHGPSPASSVSANWEEMLKILTASRGKILKGAEPYWHDEFNNIEIVDSHQNAQNNAPSLPLGLQNRQRIWMCLQALGVDGESDMSEVDKIGGSGLH